MANSKVQLANGTVLIDLTSDTVDAAHLASGYTAHSKSGAAVTGTFAGETKTATANGTVTPSSGKYLSSVTVAIPVYDGSVS